MKIVGQLVCGPNEPYLKETLDDLKRLTNDVVVATNNADPKTLKLLDEYDFRHYADNREWGWNQYKIKSDLLARIVQLNPDYILALDADETLPSIKSKEQLEELAHGRRSLQFYVVELWNDEQHYSKELSFWNVRMYECPSEGNRQFLRKNVHCGNAPPYYYSIPARESYVPHVLLHKGLMDPERRKRKYERYEQYDPADKARVRHGYGDFYRSLLDDSTKSVYNEDNVLIELKNYCERL